MADQSNEMTMVERVAAALEASTDKGFASWEDAARAAIEAMRTPTDLMADAMNGNNFGKPFWAAYTAALDAALQEKQE